MSKRLAKWSQESKIQELRNPRLSLVGWLFPYQWCNPCTFWHVLCLLCKFLNSLQQKKSTAIHFSCLKTRKIRGKTEKTVVPGEINLQSKHRKTALDFAHFKLNYTFSSERDNFTLHSNICNLILLFFSQRYVTWNSCFLEITRKLCSYFFHS